MYKKISISCVIMALWYAAINILMPLLSKQSAWLLEAGIPLAFFMLLVLTFEWIKFNFNSITNPKEKQNDE